MTIEYAIKNHRLDGVKFIASPNIGGTMTPELLVNHYTAGYGDDGTIATFLNKASKVSAHLVIDRDGDITQMVPFNRVAWHAGPSRYQSWQGLNQYAIGIEFENIGYVKRAAGGGYVDWRGKVFTPDPGQVLVEEAEPRIGSGTFFWPSYTDIQIETGLAAARAIHKKYGLKAALTHEEIDTRGWKTDPGPAFPQQLFKNLLLDERVETTVPGVVKAEVTASKLNVRSGAGPQWEAFAQLLRGSLVSIIEQVGDWSYISFENNRNGWVATQYLRRV